MIYNENGMIINNYFSNNKINLEAFDLLCEATSDPKIEKQLQTLKDAINDCSPESLSKIKSEDKKYNFLTNKVRKVLGSISFISSLGAIGSTIPIAVSLQKHNTATAKIIGSICAFFSVVFLTLSKIVRNSDNNKNKYIDSKRKEMEDLSKDAIDKLSLIYQNNKLPKETRDKVKENIENIKNIVAGRESVKNNEPSNYLNFEINGIKVYSEIDEDKFNKNKSFYNSALKCFKSKFNSEMKRIRKELKDFGEGYENYADGYINDIVLDDKYGGPTAYDTNEVDDAYDNPDSASCACLNIYLEDPKNVNDKDSLIVKIHMIYTKSEGYYTCGWDAR